MTSRARRGLAVAVAIAHAVVLAVVVGGLRGLEALSTAATWSAIIGASLAVGAEAACQGRDDADVQPALETVTGLSLLVLVVTAALGASASPWALVGGVAVGVGIALRVAASIRLGASFGTRPRPGDALVTEGIYARLRHPSEVGLASLAGGFAMMAGSAVAAATWLLLVVVAVARVRREEAELERRHGARYRRYRFSRSSARG